MNRKEVFLKCQQCINDIQTAANSKTFIKYRKEQITLRYFLSVTDKCCPLYRQMQIWFPSFTLSF